ncbi:ADP compounds hydrolase NudE [Methylomonas sp. SURF-2]|uniref:ADP compounds hydrolase NudE n=1 Tax=Methylomonas subterranea TaxID=2952225 RepID=A0ABT1TG64_9GAMM|nr:ADP compounds hydrolase NudE [Methylomonas sp. SURF-2]MCQ8104453.1 ADP compounds hydrolase NudE [Methylomonas sp. SURF-2]
MSRKMPIIHSKAVIAETRQFRIEALQLEFSSGQQRRYERLARGGSHGAVLVVPMLDHQTVLLVREYAAGLHRYELGLPKGKIDPGEDNLSAANRELKEEVGYGARRLRHLHTVSMAPAYLEHTIDIILAEQLYPEKLAGDEPEELEVVPWSIHEIDRLMRCGECSEARSIAALYLTAAHLRDRLIDQPRP